MRDYCFRDILSAKQRNDYDKLNEASLGRMCQYLITSERFAIITPWCGNNTEKENLTLFEKLQNEIRSLGYGFVKLRGHWRKCQDDNIPYDKCPNDKLVDSIEPSLFIPKITLKEVKRLTKKYEQDASIYGGPETNGNVVLIYKDGKQENIGKFHPAKIAQAYSKVCGKSFVFAGFEYVTQSWIQSVIEKDFNR